MIPDDRDRHEDTKEGLLRTIKEIWDLKVFGDNLGEGGIWEIGRTIITIMTTITIITER